MKKYKRRPGVVLLRICGEYLLVATKDARDLCPYVTQINNSAATYWDLFDDIYSINDYIGHVAQSLNKEKKEVMLQVLVFVEKMEKSGYLTEVEQA